MVSSSHKGNPKAQILDKPPCFVLSIGFFSLKVDTMHLKSTIKSLLEEKSALSVKMEKVVWKIKSCINNL